ncbi:diacylglycerol kinase family lipid kinase [Alkaliphilus pronyensis]|uniref:Diacylglycerol kinase family lipid kinase n=1 Tax=Alkaliphilus pronyensis TaxID=1482732 RepID=A0A6I0FD41_9FIRM|nr:diacylglycerol kinase family protein [Alkaliphilus pronyensis]KAB3531881.1 diacylglycerol kinase family lipid kinase [Alkaliphilus pronyensis]
MEDKTYLFIVNPVSGNGKGRKMVDKIHKAMAKTKKVYRLELTKGKGYAKRLALAATEDVVVAVGGDGTINEVVNGIIKSDKVLGVVPSGTGNDFIRNLDIPKEPEKALERILNGEEIAINVGKAFEHYFVNIASVGLDAEIANEANRLKKFFNGTTAYVVAFIKALLSFNSISISIKNGKGSFKQETTLMALCNGKSYGGGMKIAPLADMGDDLLDICIVKKINKLKLLLVFPTIFTGKHTKFKEVQIIKEPYISLRIEDPVIINLDGEIYPITKEDFEVLEFKISKFKLKVLC